MADALALTERARQVWVPLRRLAANAAAANDVAVYIVVANLAVPSPAVTNVILP